MNVLLHGILIYHKSMTTTNILQDPTNKLSHIYVDLNILRLKKKQEILQLEHDSASLWFSTFLFCQAL